MQLICSALLNSDYNIILGLSCVFTVPFTNPDWLLVGGQPTMGEITTHPAECTPWPRFFIQTTTLWPLFTEQRANFTVNLHPGTLLWCSYNFRPAAISYCASLRTTTEEGKETMPIRRWGMLWRPPPRWLFNPFRGRFFPRCYSVILQLIVSVLPPVWLKN